MILYSSTIPEVKVIKHKNLKELSGEEDACAKLDTVFSISLDLHNESHDAQHKLGKPNTEPVDIVAAIGQKILRLS